MKDAVKHAVKHIVKQSKTPAAESAPETASFERTPKAMLLGAVLVLLGGVLWGINATVSKLLMADYHADPLWIACVRELAAGALFLACAGVRTPKLLAGAVRDRRSYPMLLFAALNIAFGGARPGIAEAVYLLFAVFGEEVLFRGVLPAVWGEKLGAAGAAAASAALFALLHLGSAVGGSVSAAAVQALCAFGAGLLLTAVRARTGSIALPLLAHALINLTGSGAVSAAPRAAAYLAASALCTLCALRLLRDAA